MLRKTDAPKLEKRKLASSLSPPTIAPELSLAARVAAAFAPVNARALAISVGLTLGLLVALVTTFHVIVRPSHAPNIGLLAHYYYGYAVSPQGIAVGFIWAFVTGLVLGWFAGTLRNVALRLSVTLAQRRGSLSQPFLDDLS